MAIVEEVFLRSDVGRGALPTEEHFGIRTCEPVADLAPGEVCVRTIYLAISPSLRFSLNPDSGQTSAAGRVLPGETLCSDGIGVVLESHCPGLAAGDLIASIPKLLAWPWRSQIVLKGSELAGCCFRVPQEAGQDTGRLARDAVGCTGLTGLTSFFGVRRVLRPEQGETVIVSGAAGACGSVAGQLAALEGAIVVGITSSEAKVEHLKELGFHAAILHRGKSEEKLAEEIGAVCPRGVDCYFDNVGGGISAAVAHNLSSKARVAICGAIGEMGMSAQSDQRWVQLARDRGAVVQWFRYTSYLDDLEDIFEAREYLSSCRTAGRLKFHYTVYEGLSRAGACFVDMFRGGDKLGKGLVAVTALEGTRADDAVHSPEL